MGRDLAIDLGTANTLVYRQGDGIVFNEPTIIAVDSQTGSVVAMGGAAWAEIDRSPGNVVAARPLSPAPGRPAASPLPPGTRPTPTPHLPLVQTRPVRQVTDSV